MIYNLYVFVIFCTTSYLYISETLLITKNLDSQYRILMFRLNEKHLVWFAISYCAQIFQHGLVLVSCMDTRINMILYVMSHCSWFGLKSYIAHGLICNFIAHILVLFSSFYVTNSLIPNQLTYYYYGTSVVWI